MLSISLPMRGGGSGDYYLKLAQQEYYTKSVGRPGEWFGKGAEALGLQGKVQADQFKNLLEGRSPDGSKSLVQIQKWEKRERQSGWDMTFSAPKSVGVLWSQSSEEVRAIIEDAHQAAVKKALAYLETEAAITRRGAGGREWEKTKVVFALFQHGTSRANDPQPHTHAVLVNLSVRADGTTGALRSKGFFENKMNAGAVYQLEFATELREKMNLKVVADRVGFHIEGVPLALCREMSKRRRDIEAVVQREGDFSAQTAAKVAVLTRPAKIEIPADQLFAKWHEAGRAHGWGPEQAKKLVDEAAHTHNKKKHKKRSTAKASKKSQTRKTADHTVEEFFKKAQKDEGSSAQKEERASNGFREAGEDERKRPYFRFGSRLLFPRAPGFSPFKNVRIPIPVLGENKSKDWWGKARWKMETPLGQLQFRDKYLFPNAPEWSPLKNWTIPRLVLRQNTEWQWRTNLWKKNTTFGQLQLRWKAIFPRAAENSIAYKLAMPAFRLQTKRPEYQNERMTKQTHSH